MRRACLAALIVLCLVAAGAAGLAEALDNRLSELRFASRSRPPTGGIVLVDIDARSIAEIGVWPWPRHLHGDLVSAAAASGAARLAFDIDFSSASSEAEDEAFAASLSGAGIETYLAAFAQPETTGAASHHTSMPIERLLSASWPASVDVPLDADGRVRRFPFVMQAGTETLASMPSILAQKDGGAGSFGIDFSISAERIPRVSFVDVLHGRIGPSVLAGKTLIVGASAVELHDHFPVPVFGVISGATIIALATETLLQDLSLVSRTVPWIHLALIGLGSILIVSRIRTRRAVVLLSMTMVAVEAAALYLQQREAIVLETAELQGLLAGLIVWTLFREFDLGRFRLWTARTQASNSQNMLERVVDDSFDGILIVDGAGSIARINVEACALLGLSGSEAALRIDDLPEALKEAVAAVMAVLAQTGADPDRNLRQIALAGGRTERVLEYSIAPFWMKGLVGGDESAAQDIVHACVTLRDVTDRERAQQRLRHMALHDSLTGLGNRRSLEARIESLGRMEASADGVALLSFDLDRFKAVNDALGHVTGDQVLVETARRAREVFGEAVLLTRIGGDEFAVLMRCEQAERAEREARRLLKAIAEPYQINGHRISIATSIGIGWWPMGALNATDMMRKADIALYRAKSISADRITIFEDAMEVDRLARLELEQDLEAAFDANEFEVVYQPQVRLATAEIIGAEALIRWKHPSRGYVSPVSFIPVAEEMGYIHRLGAFVLDTACAEAAKWPGHMKVAVNVSAVQFEAGDIVSAVRHALARSGLPARRLELEITESAFVAETSRLRLAFDALIELGVSFALDDFGTGYSSLGYLHRFPISKIKIDRSFVTDATSSRQSVAVLKSVMALAEGLEIRTIAEGIETVEQADILRNLGCQDGQGYLYSKPIGDHAFRCIAAEPLARRDAPQTLKYA